MSFMDGHYGISPGWSPSDLSQFVVAVQRDILFSSSFHPWNDNGFSNKRFLVIFRKTLFFGVCGVSALKKKIMNGMDLILY